MEWTPVVVIECDRCHRPHSMLIQEDDGHVRLDGPHVPDGGADLGDLPYWREVITGPNGARYSPTGCRAWSTRPGRMRPGAYVLDADRGLGQRLKLICVGRRHGVYERTVSGLEATFHRATSAGRDARIGMSDVHA